MTHPLYGVMLERAVLRYGAVGYFATLFGSRLLRVYYAVNMFNSDVVSKQKVSDSKSYPERFDQWGGHVKKSAADMTALVTTVYDGP
ncbi:hypothetical protein EVAR_83510_1 [Eumeta japonica]|uniref:Uncharacterized protein n=1 Tax=Eumeta variegata TaxID=151549 RepID=A0A4C1Y2J2_EUMVA|nr:hypothetical protein EVAR_83510_1 [Eumeta japonica]